MEDIETVIITGPNTGGKTVTLKTLGLIIVMAQSGLSIPTLDGSQLSVFKNVYCDIGDEQSGRTIIINFFISYDEYS